jgi:hypothetical protein
VNHVIAEGHELLPIRCDRPQIGLESHRDRRVLDGGGKMVGNLAGRPTCEARN